MNPRKPLRRKANASHPIAAATDMLSPELLGDRWRGPNWATYYWTRCSPDECVLLIDALLLPDEVDIDLHLALVNEVARLGGAIGEELLP